MPPTLPQYNSTVITPQQMRTKGFTAPFVVSYCASHQNKYVYQTRIQTIAQNMPQTRIQNKITEPCPRLSTPAAHTQIYWYLQLPTEHFTPILRLQHLFTAQQPKLATTDHMHNITSSNSVILNISNNWPNVKVPLCKNLCVIQHTKHILMLVDAIYFNPLQLFCPPPESIVHTILTRLYFTNKPHIKIYDFYILVKAAKPTCKTLVAYMSPL